MYMAIYKSSFNKNKEVEKKEKLVKERPEKPAKAQKEVKAKKFKLNKYAVSLVVFGLIFLVCVLPSNFLKNFLLGSFGLCIYPVCVIAMLFSVLFLQKRKLEARPKYIVFLVLTEIVLILIFHLILTNVYHLPLNNFGEYISATYRAKTTAGGVVFSLLCFPIIKLLTIVGAYIFSFIALAILVGLIVDYIVVDKKLNKAPAVKKLDFNELDSLKSEPEHTQPIEAKVVTPAEAHKSEAKRKLGLEGDEATIISSNMPNISVDNTINKPMSKREYILTPIEPILPVDNSDDLFLDSSTGYYNSKKVNKEVKTNFAEEIVPNKNIPQPSEPTPAEIQPSEPEYNYPQEQYSAQDDQPTDEFEDINLEQPTQQNSYDDIFLDEDEQADYKDLSDLNEQTLTPSETDFHEQDEEEYTQPAQEKIDLDADDVSIEEIKANLDNADYVEEFKVTKQDDGLGGTVDTEVVRPSVDISKFNLPNVKKSLVEEEPVREQVKQKMQIPPYVAPPADLLNYMENTAKISDEELQDNIDRLEQVLADFKVPAKVNNVQVGPAVTRYELTMPRGISVNKIAQMADDIAMTLASNGAIRVEAPIPGKNSVGIEVPNTQITPVSLRELIDSNEFKTRINPLSFVLGKDINGDIIFCNLDKMPHVLVAGSTGSGKSVCLNTMLLSMCYKAGPQDLRLILVDPKMVEFSTYNGLPHLLIPEVITNKDMTINALDWAIKEMERRYALFAKNRVVNINEFNKLESVRNGVEEKLPFIVIVVDELADLMLDAKREIEDRIAKLAAKARAAGIHLVLATQRPSVDVITGTVKANLPSRIAFALTNYMDSKTVLDGGGAEKLLGKGDMLFKPQDKPEPRRVQGAFVSNQEIASVVEFIKTHNNPVYDEDAGRAIKNPNQSEGGNHDSGSIKEQEFDPVLKDALRLFIQNKQASGSMISRRYSVGFNRAGRIMDQMERAGFIGPQEGSKPRQVLITMDEYLAIFGDDEN